MAKNTQIRRFIPLVLSLCAQSLIEVPPAAVAAEKAAPAPAGAPAPAPAPAPSSTPTSAPKSVNKEELRKKLTPTQYEVTCNAATEPAFRNAYWDNHAVGLYVDVIDGEPLFASNHKFDSGSGWPSFFQPVTKGSIVEKEDRTHNMVRIEVISTKSGAHLGHLFPDGPRPTGMRYCINSASLRFIPVTDLDKEGYGKLRPLFQEAAGAAKEAAGAAKEPAPKAGSAVQK